METTKSIASSNSFDAMSKISNVAQVELRFKILFAVLDLSARQCSTGSLFHKLLSLQYIEDNIFTMINNCPTSVG